MPAIIVQTCVKECIWGEHKKLCQAIRDVKSRQSRESVDQMKTSFPSHLTPRQRTKLTKLVGRKCMGSQDGLVVINSAFHLCDPGSTLGPGIVCGLSFSRFQPDSEGFSPGTPVFLPQQNRLTAYPIRLWCCAPRSYMVRFQGTSA